MKKLRGLSFNVPWSWIPEKVGNDFVRLNIRLPTSDSSKFITFECNNINTAAEIFMLAF